MVQYRIEGETSMDKPEHNETQGTENPGVPNNNDEGAHDEPMWEKKDSDRPAGGPGSPLGSRSVTISVTTLAQIGLVVVALLVVGVIFLVSKNSDSDSPESAKGNDKQDVEAPKESRWPATIDRRPARFGARGVDLATLDPGSPGVFLWADYDGWHLWVARGQGFDAISGTITGNDKFNRAAALTEGQGTVELNERTITFDFTGATDPIVGAEFNIGFFSEELTLQINEGGKPMTEPIQLGGSGENAANPLVLKKSPR